MSGLPSPDVLAPAEAPPGGFAPSGSYPGVLHVHVAFDWGDEIDLGKARSLVPAETYIFPRRRRTPPSITYRPAPLRLALPPCTIECPEIGSVQPQGEVTLFDFAAVSVALHIPFRLFPKALTRLAGWLADPAPLIKTARACLEGFHRKLLPAIQNPLWQDDLSEEYFVFQLLPETAPGPAAQLLQDHAGWLAGLVRLESGPLSDEEIVEALRRHLSYSPDDLFVADWAAAFLLDRDCDETLQVIEFANLQLLEYRHIDNRLDDNLAGAVRLLHPLPRSWSPWFLRSHVQPLRQMGELKVEASGLFERTGNVLKLVGDQYLARVYRLVDGRFHLEEWEQSIQRKLEVAEGIYQVVSDQAASHRTEFLEVIVILLILLEVVLALIKH
jgi:hypothetical protein